MLRWFLLAGALMLALSTQPGSIHALGTTQRAVSVAQAAPGRPRATFTHVGIEQGLSDQQAWAVLQDHTGFMWLATRNGLDRYDGYEIVHYRHDPADPSSLSGNVVQHLFEDHAGRLWVSVLGMGLDAFDPSTERFAHYRADAGDPGGLSSDTVSAIGDAPDGSLWVGTYGAGVNRLDPTSGTFTHFLHNTANPESLSNDTVSAVYSDSSGTLWIGTADGLNRFDPARATFTIFRHDPSDPRSLTDGSVADILEDRDGALWIATQGGGLDRFDPTTNTFEHYRHDPTDARSISSDQLQCLAQDSTGALWIATWGGGLSVLGADHQTFANYMHDPTAPTSLSSDFVTCVKADSSGLIWSTGQHGVDIYDPRQQAFAVYRSDPNVPESLASDLVDAVYEARDGTTWVGTQDHGLDRLDRATGRAVHYPADISNPSALGSAWVSTLAEDTTGMLWVGTFGGGLFQMDPGTGTFTGYRHDSARADSLSSDFINSILVDPSGALWVATNGGGVDRLDTTSNSFHHFRHDPDNAASLSSDTVLSLAQDQSARIWAGTWGGGLDLLDAQTGQVATFRHDPQNGGTPINDFVAEVHVDRAGLVWVGTYGGLDRLDASTSTFAHYGVNNGLASDYVESILEDRIPSSAAPGNIWVTTPSGLSRFDRRTQTFLTYDASSGLPIGVDFTPAGVTTSQGDLLFGSVLGLIDFRPDAVLEDRTVPAVAFTGFLLENRPVPVGTDSALHQSINDTDSIPLTYADRVITIEFAALSYAAPRLNRYRYILQGFDSSWTEVDGSRRIVTYTNLDPGTYVFRVMGSNRDGVWNDVGRTLELDIAPPWWLTWWFRGLIAALLIALLLAIYVVRVTQLNSQRRELERLVAERTSALESALASRDVFLRTLAHDLKTPFSGLAWQSQVLLRQARSGRLTSGVLEQGLEAIVASAAEAVGAIDELRDLTRLEGEAPLPLNREQFDLVEFVGQQVKMGTVTAHHRARIESTANQFMITADRARLSRVVSNLLDNAAKYSPVGSEIVVSVSEELGQAGSEAVVRVRDSGVGIPEADLPKVFERYHRGGNVEGIPGEGLGLASVRALVGLHGGTVDVASRENVGTTITVRLPLFQEADDRQTTRT